VRQFSDRAQAGAVALVVAVTVAACSGGGGGGGGGTQPPTQPPPPARMISWSGDANPGPDTIFVEIRTLNNPDEFELQLRVNEISALYGLALDIIFPDSNLDFVSEDTEEGDFLFAGGNFETELNILEDDGRLIIGYSRLGDVSGRTGNGLLLRLYFRTTANGSSLFEIDNELAINTGGAPINATWLGGTVQVQR